MAWTDFIVQAVFWIMALFGALMLPVSAITYVWLKQLLTVPLRVKLRGGKMALHTRNIGLYPVYIPASQMSYEIEDKQGRKQKFKVEDDSLKLLAGIPTMLSCDTLPKTFAASKLLELAREMANSHIKNLNSFSVPIKDDKGNIVYREIPLYDENTGEQLKDALGNLIVRKVPMLQYFPIDPNMPEYDIPPFLSSKSLADQIETEAMMYAKINSDKNTKTILYLGAALGLAGIGAAALALVLIYAPKEAATAATSVVSQVSTTMFMRPPTTSFPISPLPMGPIGI